MKEKMNVCWSDLANSGQIGSGAFGTVHLMTSTRDDSKYAMKVIYVLISCFLVETHPPLPFHTYMPQVIKLRKAREKHEALIKSEIAVLETMNSPFICKLNLYYSTIDAYYLLLEFIEGGDMKSLIYPRGEF